MSALLAGPAASALPVAAGPDLAADDPLDIPLTPFERLEEIAPGVASVPETITDRTANPTCRVGVGVNGQCPVWTDRYDPPADMLDGMIAADSADGRVVVTGVSEARNTSYDVVTIAYEANATTGDRLWTARWDGARELDGGIDVVIDEQGHAQVVAVTEDPGGDLDIVRLTYDAATGEKLDEDRYEGDAVEVPTQAALGPQGRLYVAASLLDGSEEDGLVVRFDDDAIRSRRLDRRAEDALIALDVGPDGRVVATGAAEGANTSGTWTVALDADLDVAWEALDDRPGSGTAVDVTADGAFVAAAANDTAYLDYRIVRYDDAGDEVWRTVHDGSADYHDVPTGLIVDERRETVVVTGSTIAPLGVSVNPAATWDGTTLGLDVDDGQIRWQADETGTGASNEYVLSMDLDPDRGEAAIAGYSLVGSASRLIVESYDVASGRPLGSGRYDGPGDSYDIASDVTLEGDHAIATGVSTGPSQCAPLVGCAVDDLDAITAAFDRSSSRLDRGL